MLPNGAPVCSDACDDGWWKIVPTVSGELYFREQRRPHGKHCRVAAAAVAPPSYYHARTAGPVTRRVWPLGLAIRMSLGAVTLHGKAMSKISHRDH
jgi:hypothetical protein